jgi:hypothetical protein
VRLIDESRPNAIWWEDEGRRIAPALAERFSAVIVAADPEDAAAVALGIAEVHALRRRAVVADLTGDLATVLRLVADADVDGVSDSFRYGVSLNRIAQRVGKGENLFVLPSGTEPVLDDDIYRNDRWRRLVAGFREVGALLLLVAPASAPALADLVAFTDGAIVIGDATAGEGVPVIATARPPRSERRSQLRSQWPAAAAPPANGKGRSHLPLILGASFAALVVAGIVVARVVSFAREDSSVASAPTPSDTVASAASRTLDSAAATVASELPPIVDAADSARAAGWSVELARFSTAKGALIRVRDELPSSLPGRTFALVPSAADRTLWYRVLAGASPTRAGADSVLAALRSSRVIDDPAAGTVVDLPLAFRVEQDVAAGSAPTAVRQYLTRGIPAYALLQDDGSATIYAGAFDSAEQAALLIPSLRAAGIEPTLTYRLGRTF